MGNLCAMFKIFGLAHFIYLFLAIGIAVALIFVFRKSEGKMRKYAGIGIVATAGFFVLLEFIGEIIVVDNVFEHLPIKMCQIFVYICIYIEVTKSSSWTKFGYLIILPLTVLTLLFVPNVYLAFNVASLSVISYFFINSLLIAYVILRLIWNDEYLEKKDVLNVTVNYAIILAFAHILNVIFRFSVLGTDANYFGTMGENYDMIIGLIDKIIPIPFVNLIPLIAVLVGIEFLLKLPFDILKTQKERKAQYEELVALGNLKAQAKYRKNNKSQILVRSETKAQPSTHKTSSGSTNKDGFISINKSVNVNKDKTNNSK
ncbi:MAG: hypothetical protein ACI4PF_00260 [Christensenellales bacterium]